MQMHPGPMMSPSRKRGRSIGAVFAICMLAISAASAAGASWMVLQSLELYQAAQVAHTVGQVARRLLVLQEKIKSEGIPVMDALSADPPAQPGNQAKIARARAALDRAAADLLDTIATTRIEGAERLRRMIEEMMSAHRANRLGVDQALALPRAQRVPQLTPGTIDLMNRMVARIEPELDHEGAMLMNQDGALVSLFEIARAAFRLRLDGGGQIQALIEPLTTQRPIPAAGLEKLAAQDVALRDDWRQIDGAFARLPPDPVLTDKLTTVRTKIMQGEELIHAMAAAGRGGASYGTTFQEFGPKAVSYFVVAPQLRDAALDAADRKVAALFDRARAAMAAAFALLFSTAAIAYGVTFALRRRIVRRIEVLTAVIGRIVEGDLDTAIPPDAGGDEIGRMSAAIETLRRNAINARLMEAEQQREREAKAARSARLEALVHLFEADVQGMLAQVNEAGQDLMATSHSLGDTASRTRAQSGRVAQAAGLASGGVQTVAAAAEQLSASIAEITRQVAVSSGMTIEAVEEARHTSGVVDALAQGAKRIDAIVSLIAGIAGQTNLLALNATIEAARAGAAGAGFSVVASEVKSLAQQTAAATSDISRQVAGIQSITSDAVGAIQRIVRTIERISEVATTIAAAVEEQSAATSEIARNVQETASRTQDVSDNIAGVTASVEETEQSSARTLKAATGLSEQSAALSAQVRDFVGGVRAA